MKTSREPASSQRAIELYRQTVVNNPYLRRSIPSIWEGATPRQFIFLTYPAKEILYGGAAGGGKSVALLISALQFIMLPNYAAILFRRTFADLGLPKALIPLSHLLLQGTDAHWDGQRYRWTFPNNSSLSFGYLDTELDKYRYQGAEFGFVGFDELTQFPEASYRYLMSRLRKPVTAKYPLRVRASSNPGGAGHEWVKARFVDRSTSGTRVFVPARLEDNPHLDRETYDDSLRELDAVTRAQLREGNWDISAGRYFRSEWMRYYRREGDLYHLITGGENDRYFPVRECLRFMTADVAGTEKDDENDPDYSVFAVWDLTDRGDLILIDLWRNRCEEPEVVRAGARLMRQHDAQFAIVEKNGLGTGVVSTMRHKGLTVSPVNVKTNKITRAQTAMVRMEAGMIFLNAAEPNLDAIRGELMGFPTAAHDDIVDTFSLAAIRAQQEAGAPPTKEDADELAAVDREETEAALALTHAGRATRALDEYADLDLSKPAEEPDTGGTVWMGYDGDDEA